jgi:hypothetical protein
MLREGRAMDLGSASLPAALEYGSGLRWPHWMDGIPVLLHPQYGTRAPDLLRHTVASSGT